MSDVYINIGLIAIVIIQFISIHFLLKSRTKLLDVAITIKNALDKATEEITRISFLYLKSKRELNKYSQDENEIELDIDVILDKITKNGYNNLTKEEKEFLNKQH